MTVFKVMVLPVLYGMESWVLPEVDEHKLEATFIRMLPSCYEWLEASPILRSGRRRTWRRLGRRSEERVRMAGMGAYYDEERLPRRTLCGCVTDTARPRKRPPLRWTHKMKGVLADTGVGLEMWRGWSKRA
jgi:hypothetical protein